MKTIASRSSYLSGTVTPLVRTTLRRLRLDFGSELIIKNQTLLSVVRGDDYSGAVWGDSCTTTNYKIQVIAGAAWDPSGSTTIWTRTGTDWAYGARANTFELHGYCRLGVYPNGDNLFVWRINTDHELYLSGLNSSNWGWTALSSAQALTAAASYAVHPVSATTAVVIGFTSPYLWAKVCTYADGSWTASDDWVIHMSPDLEWTDAHWSDAVVSPADATKYVVAVNLDTWGSAHTVLYDTVSGLWSQPKEVLPSAEQWGNLKVWVSGMTVINSRIWAVTVRQPVASGDVRMAHHVALASSTNGIDWADEYFVTESTLRGKLLYVAGEDYCYVAGNTGVAQADATNRLGYDNATLKHSIVEGWGLSVDQTGVGSAPEISIRASNTDDTLSTGGLLEVGNEIQVELGVSGGSYSDYCKGLLSSPARSQNWISDEISLQAYGYSGRILGGNAYAPIAAKSYQNPWFLYSKFTSDTGSARQTIRQITGTWKTAGSWEKGRYIMHCDSAGIALLPYKLTTPSFIMRVEVQGKVSLEGNYIVFWYEDEDNYWRAGVYRDVSQHKLVIQQYSDGTLTTRNSLNITTSVDLWRYMYVDARPGMVRVWRSATTDFSAANTVAYATTPVTPPVEHHLGLECEAFVGWEGAVFTGQATGSTSNSISDSSETFDSSVLGLWVRCNDISRQIKDYTAHKLIVSGYWGTNPTVGDTYGVYTEDATDGPKMWCSEIWACEARVPWTVDDIINNMLTLCSVSRNYVFTSTAVGLLSESSSVARDIDLKITTEDTAGNAVLWGSTCDSTGAYAYSGTTVSAASTAVTLSDVVQIAGSPYQDITVAAIHPTLVTTGTNSREIRIQASHEIIVVSCDGHFLTAFPTETRAPEGYLAYIGTATASTTEFPEMIDFIWDATVTAGNALTRLLQGRRAKIVERYDGSVAVSRFDAELGGLGTYSTPLVETMGGDRAGERVALVEMVGAEERAFYLDPTSARYRLNFIRADNPTLVTQEQALAEAKRLATLSRQRASALQVALYITDPAAELEDKFKVSTTDYIIESCRFAIGLSPTGVPEVTAQISGRAIPDAVSTGVFDTATYDGTTKYGG